MILLQVITAGVTESLGVLMALNHVFMLVMFSIPIVLLVVVYYDLRVRKEGLDLELLERSLRALEGDIPGNMTSE